MKKSIKILLYLLAGIILFGAFIYYLLKPSKFSIAKKRMATCMSIADVKSVWDQYNYLLNGKPEFADITRAKLSDLGLTKTELRDVKKWMPAKTDNINLIIIPDLSKRITDSINNPRQIYFDTSLLSSIWHAFESKTRLKMNSKDRLLIDITDPEQGQGEFSTIANELVFDLSEHKNQSNRLYFAKKSALFYNRVKDLYKLATVKTTGADYSYYFTQKIESRQKKSTLEDDYRNIVLILTDGYLEVTLPQNKTGSVSPSAEMLNLSCKTGNASSFTYPATTLGLDLSSIEVYLFEFNERKTGKNCHLSGLKRWWSEWFRQMQVAKPDNEFIIQHQDAIKLSQENINAILGVK